MKVKRIFIAFVVLCMLISIVPLNATGIGTSTSVVNPVTVENIDVDTAGAINTNMLEISVEVSDVAGFHNISYVKVLLTDDENLGTDYNDTGWLSETVLNEDDIVTIVNETTAIYNGTLSYSGYQPTNYYLEVQAVDKWNASGSWLNDTNPQIAFTLSEVDFYTHPLVTAIKNTPIFVYAPDLNATIEFVTTSDATGWINIVRSVSNSSFGDPDIGIFLDIDVSSELSNISYALLNVGYDDADVIAQNIDEKSLRLYWLNESSGEWVRLEDSGSPPWVIGAGVDTVNNTVWAKVPHFSKYAVGGELRTSDSISNTDNSGGSRGGSSSGLGSSIESRNDDNVSFSDDAPPESSEFMITDQGNGTEAGSMGMPSSSEAWLESAETALQYEIPSYGLFALVLLVIGTIVAGLLLIVGRTK